MKRILALLLFCAGLLALPARAHLEGIMPLAADDTAALASVAKTPARHVLLYFGDHAN